MTNVKGVEPFFFPCKELMEDLEGSSFGLVSLSREVKFEEEESS